VLAQQKRVLEQQKRVLEQGQLQELQV